MPRIIDSTFVAKITDADGNITYDPNIIIIQADDSPGILVKDYNGNIKATLASGDHPITYNDTVWDDIVQPSVSTKLGANDKPDYDFTNIGLLFPQNQTNEKVYMSLQMPHKKQMDSGVFFHIHYIQSEATQPTFTIEYKFYNNNGLVPGSATTINTSDADGSKGVFAYASGDLLQIAIFPIIASPSSETVSACLDIILYRDDNDLTGDSLVKFFDLHYQIDTAGSKDEYDK